MQRRPPASAPSDKTDDASSWTGMRITETDSCAANGGRGGAIVYRGVAAAGCFVRDDTVGSFLERFGGLWRAPRAALFEVFLPIGFPDSVSPEYATYQAWDTVQAMCSYLRGVLSTRAVLASVGVGKEGATALAATLQWVLKDGAGMLGSLTFAAFCAGRFDVDVKAWRLFADVANNIGLLLDLLAPHAGEHFLVVLCIANLFKSMCGVSAGATKSALTAHFALKDNMGDVQAKEGSQETAVTLMGLVCGSWFAMVANDSPATVWIAFLLLTVLHTFANYRGVRCLRLPTLSPARLRLLCDTWLGGGESTQLSIEIVASSEPLLSLVLPERCCPPKVRLGVSFGTVFGGQGAGDANDFVRASAVLATEKYLLASDGKGAVAVVFITGADVEDELKAFFHASLALKFGPGKREDWLEASYAEIRCDNRGFAAFRKALQQNGWDIRRGVLGSQRFHISIDNK
eukprot:TRINITY_DN49630_c0_g1_i1.p1 TRINITY_DN49630_c0_g1~~TRINITY_DN49630_c0_g1_i1.p1  ORF type:complete len:460 (-),score=92.97 TRINITY_DN49630_c0_g1_i1:91-1470(-)